MSLYRRNSRKIGRLITATLVVILVLATDLVSGGALRDIVRGTALSIHTAARNTAGSVFRNDAFSSRRALMEENDELRAELAAIKVQTAGIAAMERESESLRDIVRLAESESGITVPVVSSLRSSPYNTFAIGAGSNDGVHVGQLVMTSDGARGYVLGRISDVGDTTALVSFALAPDVELDAIIAGAPLRFSGEGSGRAKALAPDAFDVALGDVVTSAAYNARAIGVVTAIKPDRSNAVQEIYVSVPVNIPALTHVYVALN